MHITVKIILSFKVSGSNNICIVTVSIWVVFTNVFTYILALWLFTIQSRLHSGKRLLNQPIIGGFRSQTI